MRLLGLRAVRSAVLRDVTRRVGVRGGGGSWFALSRLAVFTLVVGLMALTALVGGPTVRAARSVAARAGQVTPLAPVCKSLYPRNEGYCVRISYGNFGDYYPPGKTNANDALALDPFSGSVNAPALTMARCPGYPHGTFCTQPFTISISPNADAGKVQYTGGGGSQFACATNCYEHLTAANGGPATWCAANAKSLACTSLTSLPMRIFQTICTNAACTAPQLFPFILQAGVVTERNIPGHGETRGTGTFYTQVQLSTSGTVAPPRASLAVTLSEPPGATGLAVGGTESVTGKVTAKGGAVSAITLGKGLLSSSANAVVTASQPGLSGFALASGASRSFVFTVKGAKAGGVTLSLAASGKAGSRSVHGAGTLPLQVGRTSSAIKLVTTPSPVALTVDDSGKVVPKEVTVKISYTNKSQHAIKGIQLLSVSPEPVDPTQALDQLAFPKETSQKPTFPIQIGTVAAGASSPPVTLKLTVTGDGKYQLRALALFNDPAAPGGNGRVTAVGGQFEATVPPLFYTGKLKDDNLSDRNGSKWVTGGAPFYLSGEFKNVSSYRMLCLEPLYADNVGNAGGDGPADIQTSAPVGGELKPGQDVSWLDSVLTNPIGATRATVTVDPGAVEVQPGDSCDILRVEKLTRLAAKEVTLTKDSTSFVVHVDTSVAQTPPVGTGVLALNFFGGVFLVGPIVGTAEWIEHTIAMAREMTREALDPVTYAKVALNSPTPLGLTYATYRSYQQMIQTLNLLANYWNQATPAEKQSPVTQAIAALGHARDDAWKGASTALYSAFPKWMTRSRPPTPPATTPQPGARSAAPSGHRQPRPVLTLRPVSWRRISPRPRRR